MRARISSMTPSSPFWEKTRSSLGVSGPRDPGRGWVA